MCVCVCVCVCVGMLFTGPVPAIVTSCFIMASWRGRRGWGGDGGEEAVGMW